MLGRRAAVDVRPPRGRKKSLSGWIVSTRVATKKSLQILLRSTQFWMLGPVQETEWLLNGLSRSWITWTSSFELAITR